MVLAFGFSVRLGLAPGRTPSASRRISPRSGCRRAIADMPGGAGCRRLLELIAQDKKVRARHA